MIGTRLPHNDASAPRDLAAATREMMWACTLAAARATVASMSRGLAFWSDMLRSPLGPWMWPFAESFALAAVHTATARQERPAAETGASDRAGADAPAFASYRSASGHAAAQVTQQH
jgi:hypothetical protein